MTTVTTSATTTTTAAGDRSAGDRSTNPAGRVLATAAGSALVGGAALFFAGLASSPAEHGETKADYIASLARNPMITQASAVMLHHGNLLMGVGVLGLPLLVRGRRGAIAALIGALATALALINNSGALLSDWFHLEIGRRLSPEAGAKLSDSVFSHTLNTLSFKPGPLILIALVVLFTGLARAGVIGWWSIAGIVIGIAGLMFLPYSSPILPALGTLPMLFTIGFAGVRAVRRTTVV